MYVPNAKVAPANRQTGDVMAARRAQYAANDHSQGGNGDDHMKRDNEWDQGSARQGRPYFLPMRVEVLQGRRGLIQIFLPVEGLSDDQEARKENGDKIRSKQVSEWEDLASKFEELE